MPSSTLKLASLLAAAVPAAAQNCDCYLIDGNYPTYYRNHGFWDFRSMPENAVASPPPVPATREGNSGAPFTSDYLSWSGAFTDFWGPQKWNNSNEEFMNVNSYNNLYIEHDPQGETETFLTMRTARGSDFQTSAEFESKDPVDHASMRMRARTHGDPGACTAMFTYLHKDDGSVQETDIEVLTRDPKNTIHYTNQPTLDENENVIPGASNELTIPVPWTEWAEHRLDWTPGRTTWLLNGEEQHSQTFQAPVDPSQVILNSWSDGGKWWTGKMEEGGEAFQNVQWIELAYNVVDRASCGRVCTLSEPGSPSLL